jgi:fatty-acyl-CoA synthase
MLAVAPGTVGRPLPGTEVRIRDVDGSGVAAGRLGRIHVRSPLALGRDREGWLDTGDLGRFDEDGRLHVCGRSDDMFVSGGENVYPQEVEACLREHPGVAEAAIAVVADAEFGARMRAFVVVREDACPSPNELRAWLRTRLDRHKQPRSIELIDALPRNLLGKIDRPALKATLEEGKE